MTLPHWLLAGVIASAALLAVAVATPEPPGGVAAPHPEHPAMLVSAGEPGPGGLALGWALGALQVALFTGCFALGIRRRGGLGRLGRPIWIGLLLYEAVWAALVASSAAFARDPGGPLFGALPAPTAWMLYGLWPLPLFFAGLFLARFEDFLSEEDVERFRARLREIRAGAGD